MNKFIKNIVLLLIVLVLSYFTAPYFGGWYDKFVPQDDVSLLGVPKNLTVFVAGLPFAYVFFVSFLFELFGAESKRKWMFWLLALAVLFWISVDFYHIYFPIILGVIGFLLAKLIGLIFKRKLQTPQQSQNPQIPQNPQV